MLQETWKQLSKTEATNDQNYKFRGWMLSVLIFLAFSLLGAVKGLLDHSGIWPGRGFLAFEKIPLSLTLFLTGQLVLSGLLFISSLFKMRIFPTLAILSAVISFVVLLLTLFTDVMIQLILSGFRCCGGSYRAFESGNGLTYVAIYSFLLSAAIATYALLGARPNLIYQHRIKQII